MIFEDPTARRGRLVRGAGLALAITALAAVGLVALSVFAPPRLPMLPSALQTASLGGEVIVETLDDAAAPAPPTQPAAATSVDALGMAAKAATAPARALAVPKSQYLPSARASRQGRKARPWRNPCFEIRDSTSAIPHRL